MLMQIDAKDLIPYTHTFPCIVELNLTLFLPLTRNLELSQRKVYAQ